MPKIKGKDEMPENNGELSEILIDNDQFLYFHPNFNLQHLHDSRCCFHLSIDLAEGVSGDYTVLNVFQILPMSISEINGMKVFSNEYDFFKQVQIGIFRCNTMSVPDFAQYSYHFMTELFELENIKVTLENNYEGNYYRNIIVNIYGENNEIEEEYTFVSYPYSMKDDQATSTRIGINQNEPTKDYGCKLVKDQIKSNQTILTEKVTVTEALAFAKNPKKKGKGSYESMIGNDDCIMTAVNSSYFRTTEDFQELCDIISPYCSREFFIEINKKLNRRNFDDENGNSDDISDIFG